MKLALVVPHIFMQRDILPQVIFSPGQLALDLAAGLHAQGIEVTLCTPGPVDTPANNLTADLTAFEAELAGRGDSYTDLLKKHPLTFITLARQVQAELLADVLARANAGDFDVVHVYTNEEDTALPFAKLCTKPVVFTHHDPFNFLVKYKAVFPKYKHLNWIVISDAQRAGMPADTNWLGTIYHGLDRERFQPVLEPVAAEPYVAYLGRIIEPKGVHLAITAVQQYNQANSEQPLKLKIAGKHYSGDKDHYWQTAIVPQLDDPHIEYVGFVKTDAEKQAFLGNAQALIIPSLFEEPFGMVMIEALACGTPLIGLDSGAIPEVITAKTGVLVQKSDDTVGGLATALAASNAIDRRACRTDFEQRFTLQNMCLQHKTIYENL